MKKYQATEPVRSLEELLSQDFVMFNRKVYHKGWFMSWQLQCVQAWIQARQIYKVVPIHGKTILEELLEKYPNIPRTTNNTPRFCPWSIGYHNLNCLSGKATCKECWNQIAKKP